MVEQVDFVFCAVDMDKQAIKDIEIAYTKAEVLVVSNNSAQSHVPVFEAYKEFGPKEVVNCTYLAISGAGKTFETWPEISAQYVRVSAIDGHKVAISVKFKNKPTKEDIIDKINSFSGRHQELNLPYAPKQFTKYMEVGNRPQTRLHR